MKPCGSNALLPGQIFPFNHSDHMFVQKSVIFLQGSNKVCGWCNPDPSSPRVWAMAEQFPCSCQSDAPHCSVVFIADETALCRWPLSCLMGAKAVSQEPTSKTYKHAHTHTDFTISKGLRRMTHGLPCPGKERVSKDNGWVVLSCCPQPQN